MGDLLYYSLVLFTVRTQQALDHVDAYLQSTSDNYPRGVRRRLRPTHEEEALSTTEEQGGNPDGEDASSASDSDIYT